MNPVNRAQMKEFSEAFGLTDKSDSDQFELYSIYSIINGGSGENIEPFDAHLSGTEFGLDGVAIIVQGDLVRDADEAANALEEVKNPQIDFYFFQAKTSSGFDYGEASKFFDGVKGFFAGHMTKESAQISDLFGAMKVIYESGVKKQNPGIHCFYASTGNYESQAKLERLIENTRNDLAELNIFDETRTEISMIGAGQLQRLYRAASTASDVTIEFDKAVVLPEHPSVEEGYIGYLPASELLKVISIYDDQGNITSIKRAIFHDNIRDFNPTSKINVEISSNLKAGEGDNFVYRNNGITVVAKSIDRTGNKFTIEDYQIVNGCQTSNILFINRDTSDGVNVPFRLIGTKNEEFIFSIISGTNKQNQVRDEQFWSLLPFMKNLEEYSRNTEASQRIFLERRENQYRSESIERSRILQMQPLFKAVTAGLLGAPHRAARNYRSEISDKVTSVFGENSDVRPAYAAAYLHYRLEFLWRNQKIPAATKIYRYFIIDAVCRSFLGQRSFTSLSAKEIIKFSDDVVKMASDEPKLIARVNEVCAILDKRIADSGISDSRERLRDMIRSDSFAKEVRAQYTPQ
jgi:hypothetical protein